MPYEIPNSVSGAEIKQTESMKIAILGEVKSGKSWLAATAPDPWFNDFDGRINSLAGKNISGKTYFDSDSMNPQAWIQLENDLSHFERICTSGNIPKTFVNDSMQYMAVAAMNYVLSMNPKLRREVKAGAKTYYAPGGYDAYALELEMIKGIISRQFALGNVICNFHETPEEDPSSTQERPVFSGKMTVYPVRLKKLLPLFNDQWRLIIENGVRRVITDISDYKFTASTTLLLDSKEEPDIQKMIAKHQSRLATKR